MCVAKEGRATSVTSSVRAPKPMATIPTGTSKRRKSDAAGIQRRDFAIRGEPPKADQHAHQRSHRQRKRQHGRK